MTRLLVVRHGETMFNREKRFQGWLDIPLSDFGSAQATACQATRQVAVHPVTRIYSAPVQGSADGESYRRGGWRGPCYGWAPAEIDVGKIAGMTMGGCGSRASAVMEE